MDACLVCILIYLYTTIIDERRDINQDASSRRISINSPVRVCRASRMVRSSASFPAHPSTGFHSTPISPIAISITFPCRQRKFVWRDGPCAGHQRCAVLNDVVPQQVGDQFGEAPTKLRQRHNSVVRDLAVPPNGSIECPNFPDALPFRSTAAPDLVNSFVQTASPAADTVDSHLRCRAN